MPHDIIDNRREKLVDQILVLYTKHGYPLPSQAQVPLQELEQQIDERVTKLYER